MATVTGGGGKGLRYAELLSCLRRVEGMLAFDATCRSTGLGPGPVPLAVQVGHASAQVPAKNDGGKEQHEGCQQLTTRQPEQPQL